VKRRFSKTLMALAILLALRMPVTACTACYGESDSAMAHGMNAGIITLLIIVGGVLAGVAAFFIFLVLRQRRTAARRALLDDPALMGLSPIDLSAAAKAPRPSPDTR